MIYQSRPTKGPAQSVWDAWQGQNGRPPDTLEVLNPTRSQRARGIPRYVVNFRDCAYSVAEAKAGDWYDEWK